MQAHRADVADRMVDLVVDLIVDLIDSVLWESGI
jgi:hypothetical protein